MSTNRELADEVDGAEAELAAAKAELAAAKTELLAAKATIVMMTSLAKAMLSTVELMELKKPAKKKPAALTKGQELALKALGGTASGTDDDVPITARRKRAKTNS